MSVLTVKLAGPPADLPANWNVRYLKLKNFPLHHRVYEIDPVLALKNLKTKSMSRKVSDFELEVLLNGIKLRP